MTLNKHATGGFMIKAAIFDVDGTLFDSMPFWMNAGKNFLQSLGSTTTEDLGDLRKQIDVLDNELIDLLAKRMRVSREIGKFKKEHKMTVLQAARYDEILKKRVEQAEAAEMKGDFMMTIMQAIHEESVRQQVEILKGKE